MLDKQSVTPTFNLITFAKERSRVTEQDSDAKVSYYLTDWLWAWGLKSPFDQLLQEGVQRSRREQRRRNTLLNPTRKEALYLNDSLKSVWRKFLSLFKLYNKSVLIWNRKPSCLFWDACWISSIPDRLLNLFDSMNLLDSRPLHMCRIYQTGSWCFRCSAISVDTES